MSFIMVIGMFSALIIGLVNGMAIERLSNSKR